jgi:cell division protein FtsW
MTRFSRTDTGILSQWWWTIDRWLLGSLLLLMTLGVLLSFAASPAVAETIGVDSYHFIERHLLLLPLALVIMLGISLLPPRYVKLLGVAVCAGAVALLLLTFFIGVEIKGARRWLPVGGFSLQPSEFIKPGFAILAAWLFSEQQSRPDFPGNFYAIGGWLLVFALLVLQPDLGMAVVVTAVWGTQFFLSGLPMLMVAGLGLGGVAMMLGAYFIFPHFQSRIDRFMDPGSGDTFQVQRSMEAFINGGLFGTGPGEGTVKSSIPDVHADFIFAVVGEEFGLVPSLFIVALFAYIILRGLKRLRQEQDLFLILAIAGLLTQLGLQAVINLASTVNLIPTKGMTLPFISYGGSSLLAMACVTGMLLALTRKRPKTGEWR